MLYEDRETIKASADARVRETTENLIKRANHSAVNGAMEDERQCDLHDAAAVARALLTEQALHRAWRKRAEEAELSLSEACAALAPFAAVAQHDIGDSESDRDKFTPYVGSYNRAPKLTVGDLRRALLIVRPSE